MHEPEFQVKSGSSLFSVLFLKLTPVNLNHMVYLQRAAELYCRTKELPYLSTPGSSLRFRPANGGQRITEKVIMQNSFPVVPRQIVVVIAFLLIVGTGATGQTQASLGSTVKISGYSYTGTSVYLFLTGSNLPPDGVALDNINRPADQGGATQVDVEADGHWVYEWNTANLVGSLDPGSYTIWIADGPADLSHLSTVEYTTLSVILTEPFIAAEISGGSRSSDETQTGSMNLNAVPDGTSVVINGMYKGMTPLTISGLHAGTYNVTFSHFGFRELSTPVIVQAGGISEVNVSLVRLTGSLVVNTTPGGAYLTLDGLATGTSPATLENLYPGNHTLIVTKDGYVMQILPVWIIAGQTATADVVLVLDDDSRTGGRAAGLLLSTMGGILIVLLVAVKHPRK
jgi:hypothetical protein